MKPYPVYKPSGVPWLGDVPSHWKVKKVKHVALMRSGDGITAEDIEDTGSYPVYGGNGCRGFTDRFTHSGEFVLVGRQGALCGNVHHVRGEFWASEHAVVSTFYACDSPKWAAYMFELMNLGLYSVSAAQPGLAVERIQQLSLITPPVSEQKAIAAYLDRETARIDTLITEKGRLIETLREFSCSAFVGEFVTQAASGINPHPRIEWLPAIPSDWTCCKIKHIVESFDQGVSPQCEVRPPEGDEWGVLKVGCVNTGLFDPQESKALPPGLPIFDEITLREGDVMISRANTRNLVGRCAAADKAYPRLMLSDKVYRLRIDRQRCTPAFLVDLLALPLIRQRIEERATGASASMLNIDRRTILELDIVLPPLDVQLAIVQRIQGERQGISKLVEHVASEIALLRELRSATITDAVTGKIQVL